MRISLDIKKMIVILSAHLQQGLIIRAVDGNVVKLVYGESLPKNIWLSFSAIMNNKLYHETFLTSLIK